MTDHARYKSYCNIFTKLKCHCKLKYYHDKCVEFRSNTKALWNVINNITGKLRDKTSVIACIKENGISYNTSKDIANILNSHFSTVGKKYARAIKASKKNIKEYLSVITRNIKSAFWLPTTEREVSDIITNLPNKKSSGYDNLDNTILKELKEILVKPLTSLFNRSMAEGIFPMSMKISEVVPLYKNKERELSTNYRPISLLITISKVLEKLVHKRTYQFLNDSHQIFESQYGFRSKHSCENAIQELIGRILKGLEHKQKTLAIFLDLSKAFDTISHSVLFEKLEKYGIHGNCLDWFVSYLSDRQMRVKCVGEDGITVHSDLKNIDFGCPQGSVLGPLIFLIFNNDLHLHLEYCSCILFADDTTLYYSHQDIRYLTWCIREDLLIITDWFKANKLTLNLNKSVCILFEAKPGERSSCQNEIKLIGLPVSDHTKFLGVRIDENLKWTYHYDHVMLKIKRNMNLLKQSQKMLSNHAKKTIYYGHIFSHLNYCISTWGPMLQQSQIKKLQKLQNKCVNLIDNSNKSLCKKFEELKILKVSEIIDLELCKIGFKQIKGILPKKILETISTDADLRKLEKRHRYHTRHKKLQNLPLVKNNLYLNSFLCKSITKIQPLLSITRNTDCLSVFVRIYKNKRFATSDN